MASLNRRYAVIAGVLLFSLLAISGISRANTIVVTTTDGESASAPLCSLPDAIAAHNSHSPVNGCSAGSGADTIVFGVTGTILIDESLEITSGALAIEGPGFGCSGAGPCGITIDGGGSVQIVVADPGTLLALDSLTLADGFVLPGNAGGGAIFENGTHLEIHDCLFRNNTADPSLIGGGNGGAIYEAAGTITIVNSTFANNTAVHRGDPTIHNSGTDSFGSAIFANVVSSLKITASTFSGNSADDGAIDGAGVALKGTIFSKNTGGSCNATIVDLGFNIESDASCPFTAGTSSKNTDPLLGPLANNGGPTDTFALETFPATSPAIDRIPVASCTDQSSPTPQPLGTDQRLFARPDFINLATCDSGAYEAFAVAPISLVPKSEKLQIVHSNSSSSDQVNTGFTFVYNGDPDCDLGPGGDEDALNSGFGVAVIGGTCASLPDSGLFLILDPFVVHTVNHQSYGTLFEAQPSIVLQQPNEKVSARLVAIPPEFFGVCVEWTLNLEVSGLSTGDLGLGGSGPFALLISDLNDAIQCFDITNAIVGSQIPTPRKVRRGVRR